MSIQDFISEYSGKLVKSPHGILGQCVSVSSEWAVDNGWPELFGAGDDTAYHIWENGVNGYQKIANTPAGVPAPGDIFFFGPAYGGGAGHTGVVVAATVTSVTLFEQNDPLGSGAHQKAYSYNDAMGWFHFPSNSGGGSGARVVPIHSVVNVRTAPHVTAPIVAQLHVGTCQITGQVTGDLGTVNGHTSNQWGITLNGHFFCLAATE